MLLPIPERLLKDSVWLRALKAVKAEKAAPINTWLRNWKQYPHEVAVCIGAFARAKLCSVQPSIPEDWTKVQLVWLAKPKKCPSCPENLRSIGLMAGDTKLFMMALKEATSDYEIMWLKAFGMFPSLPIVPVVARLMRCFVGALIVHV